jgi:membrane-associated phospholipid phosphatase
MNKRIFHPGLAGIVIAGLAITGSPAFAQDLPALASGLTLPAATAIEPSIQQPSIQQPSPTPALSAAPSTSTLTPARSVWRDLFLDTAGDLRRVPSRQTLGWLVIGAAAAAGSRPADPHVGRSLSTARMLEEPLEPGAVIGSTPLQLGLSAASYGIGRAIGWPRMIAVSADLFRAELVAQTLTMGMKESIRRQRPEGSGFAFPSGHTAVSFASATVLQQHFGWRAGAPAYALASYVALSRVQMQRHYLSDVAFGAALGIAAGRTITIGHERKLRVEPMAADGGGGVQFSWLGRGAR